MDFRSSDVADTVLNEDVDDILNDSKNSEDTSAFSSASSYVRSVAGSLDAETLLYLYGRYKIVTEGPCCVPKPGFFDFQGRKKWEAWRSLGSLSKEEAMRNYVAKVESLNCGWTSSEKPRSENLGLKVSRPLVLSEDDEAADKEVSWISTVKQNWELSEVREWAKNVGKNYDVNAVDEEGLTAMHWACDRGREDLVDLLVSLGSSVNCVALDGQTPLHYAVSCGHAPVVRLLLKHGADVNREDSEGNKPKDVACDHSVAELL